MIKYHIHRNDLNEILFISEIYEGPMNLQKGSYIIIKNISGSLNILKIDHVYKSTLNTRYVINDYMYEQNELWLAHEPYKVITLDEKQKSLLIGLDTIDDNSLDMIYNTKDGKIIYPENNSKETLFYIRNDGKIFTNEEKGYHLIDIKKGTLGDISKIEEELEELKDAIEQNCKIMTMV